MSRPVPVPQPPAATADNVTPFRRAGRRLRHRRRHPLIKWGKPFGTALLIVGLPAAAVYALVTSPHFALREIKVSSGPQVPAVWVERTISSFRGLNLLWLELGRIDRVLRRHPWVKGIGLRKELPSRLIVEVDERRAVAILRHERDLYYIDGEGEIITRFEPLAGPADLLLISYRAGLERVDPGAALRFVEELAAFRPEWSSGLSEVEIVGERDFRLFSSSLPFPLLVRSGTLASKARRLEPLVPQLVERYGRIEAVDLRFSRRIIVQPMPERITAPAS